jgi:S1-C subfamily serine protease
VINARPGTEIDPDMGDYLIMPKRIELPPSGKLGVFLDTEESPPEISGFSQTSGAAEAGVKEGDIILKIDDQKITSYTDIRLALMDRQVGDKVTIVVERDALILGPMRHLMEVELK